MFVVLDEDTERRLLRLAEANTGSSPFPLSELTATLNAIEDRIVVRSQEHEANSTFSKADVDLTCHLWSGESLPKATALLPTESVPLLLFGVANESEPSLQAHFYQTTSSPPQACEVEVIRLEPDLFSRVRGIFDTRILAPKTVAIIGVGSGGSLGALELAKAGVGNFILVDFDRLKAHNIIRHVCGLDDIGRFKTRAVRDAILQHNPQATVTCHQVDITTDLELLERIANSCDLVFVATDDQLSRYFINDACLGAGTPAVYGGAYERAFAGEVIRVIPGAGCCYACVRQRLADTMRSIARQQEFDYTDDEELAAEPGLGLDVSFIGLIQAKLALLTLLRGTSSALEDIEADMILWTNWASPEDGELFERPLVRHFVKVAKAPDCASCGDGLDELDELDDLPDVPIALSASEPTTGEFQDGDAPARDVLRDGPRDIQ